MSGLTGMSRDTGQPSSDTAHLVQSVADILTTPIGSRVMRRDYGSMLPELIDQPLNAATRLLVYASTAAALRKWEPRLRVTRVTLNAGLDDAASLSRLSGGAPALLIAAERTDIPGANALTLLSIPIRTGGASPVNA